MTRLQKLFCWLLPISLLVIFSSGCESNREIPPEDQSGMFNEEIEFRTMPTKAILYIDEKVIGETPLEYHITHSDSRMLNIKCVPIFPNQYTQNIFIIVPPVPKRMTIYMNHIPENYDKNKDKPFIPPAKPAPIVIDKSRVDTVYIDRTKKEPYIVTIPVVFFDTDKYNINPSEENKLQEFITALKHDQDLHIDIYGFADKRNTEEYNITLSLNRANAVRDYLFHNGIDENRIDTYGNGIARMVDTKGLEMGLQTNRKVIFVLRK